MAKKLTIEEIEKFHKMYLEGMTCEQIGKLTGHKRNTVSKYLKTNYNIEPSKKVDIEKLRELVKLGKTTKECAEYFNVYPSAISFWKKKINDCDLHVQVPFSNNSFELSELQEQMILGSLLGDLNVSKSRKQHPNCRLNLVHSAKQKELFLSKVNLLGDIMGSYKEYSYLDNRTNNVYTTIRGSSKAHPIFTELRKLLYPNEIKTITIQYLDKIHHPIALAYWFMDDGSKHGVLSTNGFTLPEVNLLANWLLKKWNIETTVQKNANCHTLYIKAVSRKRFDDIIRPYIIPSMKYKLKFFE